VEAVVELPQATIGALCGEAEFGAVSYVKGLVDLLALGAVDEGFAAGLLFRAYDYRRRGNERKPRDRRTAIPCGMTG
jgi:hypothetical protein